MRLPHRRLPGDCGNGFGTPFAGLCQCGSNAFLRQLHRGGPCFQADPRSSAVAEKSLPTYPARLLPLAARDKLSVPLELSKPVSEPTLETNPRFLKESTFGKASTKGKLRSDPSAPAHRHKLAVFPHKVVDGNGGQREEDNGRDTNTTNAGPGQADLVRPLATATVCSVPGLRIGTLLGGEPHGPGSPWIVKMMAATEDTEIRRLKAPDLKGFSLNLSNHCFISSMTRQRGSIVMLGPHFPAL